MAVDDFEEPCYVISIAARMLGVHAQTLRYYERVGVVGPSRSLGRQRLYSLRDIERLRQVKSLMNDLGVNLAGVEVILRMRERILDMERRIQGMESELKRLEEAGLQPEDRSPRATTGMEGRSKL